MNQSSASEKNELIFIRRVAFYSLFALAAFDGITYFMFANFPVHYWLFSTALTGLPLTIWFVADATIRDALKHPWQPLAAFLFWPAVIPIYVHRTRGWPGVGVLCGVCVAMYAIKLFTVATAMLVLLLLHGFPGPG